MNYPLQDSRYRPHEGVPDSRNPSQGGKVPQHLIEAAGGRPPDCPARVLEVGEQSPSESSPSSIHLIISRPDNYLPQSTSHRPLPNQTIESVQYARAGPAAASQVQPTPDSMDPKPDETGLKQSGTGQTKVDNDLESICLSVTRHALD